MASLYLSPAIRVLAPTLLADYAVQLLGFTVSTLLQTEKFYDLAGSTSFIVCTYLSLFQPWDKASSRHRAIHPRQMIACCTTVLWALYLGSFLFKRALKNGDKRFDKVKKSPAQFLVYWLVQGVWVAMTALPVYLTNAIPSRVHPALGVQDMIGFALWGFGFVFQAMANFQKLQWRKEVGKNYKRSFISHGLWSLSRHPNYFGECVLWCGSYWVSSGAFSAGQEAGILPGWMARLAMLSPVFVTVLITRVSGIPLLEKENDRRLKDVVAYWKYKKETSMFVPTWPRSVE